jgi:hypothetical protein
VSSTVNVARGAHVCSITQRRSGRFGLPYRIARPRLSQIQQANVPTWITGLPSTQSFDSYEISVVRETCFQIAGSINQKIVNLQSTESKPERVPAVDRFAFFCFQSETRMISIQLTENPMLRKEIS